MSGLCNCSCALQRQQYSVGGQGLDSGWTRGHDSMSPLSRAASPLGVFLPQGRLTPVGPSSTTSSSGRASVDALWSPIKDVLHRVFSNDQVQEPMESPVVFCDDLCLSPLAVPFSSEDSFNKKALERSMSSEAAAMDEWRGTTHVQMPGPSPMTSGSPQPKSPYVCSPATGATPMHRSLSREWDRCRTWSLRRDLPLPTLEPCVQLHPARV